MLFPEAQQTSGIVYSRLLEVAGGNAHIQSSNNLWFVGRPVSVMLSYRRREPKMMEFEFECFVSHRLSELEIMSIVSPLFSKTGATGRDLPLMLWGGFTRN